MLNKIQAQHLPKIDALGSVDPYVVLHLGPDEYKTNTIKKNYHSEWDETFTLIVKDDTPHMPRMGMCACLSFELV